MSRFLVILLLALLAWIDSGCSDSSDSPKDIPDLTAYEDGTLFSNLVDITPN